MIVTEYRPVVSMELLGRNRLGQRPTSQGDVYQEQDQKIIEQIQKAGANTGTIFFIPRYDGQQYLALLLLLRLNASPYFREKKRKLFLPESSLQVVIKELEESKPNVVFLCDIPINDLLHEWQPGETIIVAVGRSDAIPQSCEFALEVIDVFDASAENGQALLHESDMKEVFDRIIALDAVGVPAPLQIIVAGSNTEEFEEKLDEIYGQIFWAQENTQEAALCVTTPSSDIARALRNGDTTTDWVSVYETIWQQLQPENTQDRQIAYKILVGLESQSCRSWCKRLLQVNTNEDKVSKMISLSDLPEQLAWLRLLLRLRMYAITARLADVVITQHKDYRVICLKAQALAALGKWKNALPLLQEAANSGDPVVCHACAQACMNSGQFDKVAAFLEMDSATPYRQTLMATAQLSKGEFVLAEVALNLLESMILTNEQVAYVNHIKGEICAARGEYIQAFSYFNEAAERPSAKLAAHVSAGKTHLERGWWAAAERELKRALEIDRENLHALVTLAKLEREKSLSAPGDAKKSLIEQAETRLDEVLFLDESNVPAMVEKALCKAARDEDGLNDAIKYLDNCYQQYPSSAYLPTALANFYLKDRQLDLAEEYASEVSGMTPAALSVLARIGWNDEPNQAEELLQQAATGQTSRAIDKIISYNTWADILLTAGDAAKAEEKFQAALELDPDNAYTLISYGQWLQKIGRSEAQALLDRADELRSIIP